MYMKALQGYEEVLGQNHTSLLGTINNLGSLYLSQDKLEEAEAMYLRALHGKVVALGRNEMSTLNTVSNLGNLYWRQGKLK
jgi:tetratricopeptide (TPR) repeat protein